MIMLTNSRLGNASQRYVMLCVSTHISMIFQLFRDG